MTAVTLRIFNERNIGPHLLSGTTLNVSRLPNLTCRDVAIALPVISRRTKIWEFNTNLHCSIIGTCLSAGNLRQVLKKLGMAPLNSTDHELHGTAVTLAGRHDIGAKLIGKALDLRHKLAVSQFAKVDTEQGVRALWRESVQRGEIPGAYWATLTHPATTQAVIREAFGEMHMLSHLVGAANRADIKRLCEIEVDNAELRSKLELQQAALHKAIATRDATIQALRQTLAQQIAAEPPPGFSNSAEHSLVLRQLVVDLERRLASETRRRTISDARDAAAQATAAQERSARRRGEQENNTLRQDLDAVEASFVQDCTGQASETRPALRLDRVTLLYVGGRPHQIVNLRAIATRLGATFLHHDGGMENNSLLLPSMTSRADLVMFPVDCVSHDAARMVKQLCRQAGKHFIPLRTSSATSLLAALGRREVACLADAAPSFLPISVSN